MNLPPSFAIAIAGTALIAGGAGFLAGRTFGPSGHEIAEPPGDLRPASSRPWDQSGHDGSASGKESPEGAGGSSRPGLATLPPASIDAESARKAGRESLHRMLDQPGPISRWRDVMGFAETAGPDQISGALDELIGMPKGIDTIVARFFLYSRFGENDPKAALAAIEGLPPGEIDLARQSVLGGWAGKDSEAAAAYLLEQADSEGNLRRQESGLVRNVVDEWARTDPAAAFRWSLDLAGAGRKVGLSTVLRQWTAQAPADAAAAVERMAADADRGDAMRTVAEQWALLDPEAALNWTANLPDEFRDTATARALGSLADRDPRRAAETLSGLEPGTERDRAIRIAASKWSERDPREAAQWVLGLPESDAHLAAMRDVVRRWARNDEVAASEWLVEQETGPAKDNAIVALSNIVASDDPEAAAIWANTIADPTTRNSQVRSVVGRWVREDRDAALNWIQRANVSGEVKAGFIRE